MKNRIILAVLALVAVPSAELFAMRAKKQQQAKSAQPALSPALQKDKAMVDDVARKIENLEKTYRAYYYSPQGARRRANVAAAVERLNAAGVVVPAMFRGKTTETIMTGPFELTAEEVEHISLTEEADRAAQERRALESMGSQHRALQQYQRPAAAQQPAQQAECPICMDKTTGNQAPCCGQTVCPQCWESSHAVNPACPFCRAGEIE